MLILLISIGHVILHLIRLILPNSRIERRYAFVYFDRVEDAEQARTVLIRQPKWKGNISFAKKEKDASERRAKNNVGERYFINKDLIETAFAYSIYSIYLIYSNK